MMRRTKNERFSNTIINIEFSRLDLAIRWRAEMKKYSRTNKRFCTLEILDIRL